MKRILEIGSLFVLLSVVVLRPLVSESYDSAQNSMTAALSAVADPTPVRTLVFDLMILVGCGGWALSRLIGPMRRYRWTGLEWGTVMLAAAAVISCAAAGQKRLAVNASIDWLCYPVLTIGLVQLLNHPWHRRVLLAGVVACACVQASQCLEQSLFGYGDTWKYYEAHKEDFWAAQGIPLDSPRVESFERRIKSGEATGGLFHSNVTGSFLVLCAMAAGGVAIGAWWKNLNGPRTLFALGATGVVALLVAAAVSTHSLGAALSAGVGVVLWGVLLWRRNWINDHPRNAFRTGWLLFIIFVVGVVGYGLVRDALPSWSLTFRWQWWKASAALVRDHALTGVGRENFRREYLAYKSIKSPEEVANPHNLFVQAVADWGVLGLLGVLAMLIGVTRVLAKPTGGESQPPGKRGPPSSRRVLVWLVGLGAVVVFGRLSLLGTDDPNFLYYETVVRSTFWLTAFCIVVGSWMAAGDESQVLDRLALQGVTVGLFTFVLHDMINFAFFVPATATAFFALLAYRLSSRQDPEPEDSLIPLRWRWAPVCGSAVAIVVVLVVGLIPVSRTQSDLDLARASAESVLPVEPTAQRTYRYYQEAAFRGGWDPTPLEECAAWIMRVPEFGDTGLRLAASNLARAIERDPHSLKLRRMQIQLDRRWAQIEPSKERLDSAIDAAHQALALYPQDPHGYVALGDCQSDAGTFLQSKELLKEAVASYRFALELDDRRLWWEELRRFSDHERQAIEKRIANIEEGRLE